MWLAGTVGMAAGLGYYAIGLFVAVLAVLILLALKSVDRRLEEASPKGRDGKSDD
jgi:uncharacterized membrane protein YhiD involved in acid resistance